MPNARIRGGRPNMMKGGNSYSVMEYTVTDCIREGVPSASECLERVQYYQNQIA